jgi:hypothetical protein
MRVSPQAGAVLHLEKTPSREMRCKMRFTVSINIMETAIFDKMLTQRQLQLSLEAQSQDRPVLIS